MGAEETEGDLVKVSTCVDHRGEVIHHGSESPARGGRDEVPLNSNQASR